MKPTDFDCIVIGGGHAGAEAAYAAARSGCKTALLTISKETIAKMSCNPAIGGLGKGQIVREIDALGGLMGRAIDSTGIQFRLLNRSKGPAVQSPRAQADKYKYKDFVRSELEQTENLAIIEAVATDIIAEGRKVRAVRCVDGRVYKAAAIIITTGTFLKGLMHIGTERWAGGRLDEPASNELSDSLKKLGLKLARLKTGTPGRLDGKTIDFDKVEIQHGDAERVPFSFVNEKIDRPQIPCWITYTNEKIHKLLKDNLHLAPMYSGQIQSTGPRYCPSIETKIVRFADRKRHQVFLEPEDEQIRTIYCNGISTSVPKDIQQQMFKLLPGAENAKIVHYGYAIEYDYCPAIQLKANLESKTIEGLFLAGQINGTSGYEEAAAQGLMAGIGAVRKLRGKEPIVLKRSEAYTGVLIDDLLTKEIDEPYRMFTSRAEYRLSLRSDNADRRLTPIGRNLGLVDDERWEIYQNKIEQINQLGEKLKQIKMAGCNGLQLLKRPDSDFADKIAELPAIASSNFKKDAIEAVVIDTKYSGYLDKQEKLVQQFGQLEKAAVPVDFDYSAVEHLRAEAREKLSAIRPSSLGQASRVGGITPADIMVIQIHLNKFKS